MITNLKNLSSKVILHIDGDSFFASCEVAKNPALKGKPVVTGGERGVALALTYEAKARGVTRGMRSFEVLKVCPEAIILSSDYETYSLYSRRMYSIVRRYAVEVEECGIDECFADITGLESSLRMSYEEIAAKIKYDLHNELGMTFSVGLAPTKVLAKTASKWDKPSGLTFIYQTNINSYLSKLSIDKVWGIGPQTSSFLINHGIKTAYDFICKEEIWVKESLAKPYFEIWQELQGEAILPLGQKGEHSYKSISKTKTFAPASNNKYYVFSQLSKNIENACMKARRHGLVSSQVNFFLKTQDLNSHGTEVKLSQSVSVPQEIIRAIKESFDKVYQHGVLYRATGITLEKLTSHTPWQMDLFGSDIYLNKVKTIYNFVDALSLKFGKHSVFLGSSLESIVGKNERVSNPSRSTNLFKGETNKRRLSLPMIGEAS